MALHRDRNRLLAVFCLDVVARLLPGEALQAVPAPGYARPCGSAKSLLELDAAEDRREDPKTETAHDIGDEVKNMMPSIARDIMVFASPQARDSHLLNDGARLYGAVEHTPPKAGATCTVWRYNQYAFCAEFNGTLAPRGGKWTALSFGGNGYDTWSDVVREQLGVVPEVYDCFDPRAIAGTVMHDFCIGGSAEREARATAKGGRKLKWKDLNDILGGARDRSVLMKLDIESSEYGVLRELSDESLGKLAYFTVEFHFGGNRCCGFAQHRALFQRLQETFAVLDGEAIRWGRNLADCGIEGGYQWPRLLSVSYVARDTLGA